LTETPGFLLTEVTADPAYTSLSLEPCHEKKNVLKTHTSASSSSYVSFSNTNSDSEDTLPHDWMTMNSEMEWMGKKAIMK